VEWSSRKGGDDRFVDERGASTAGHRKHKQSTSRAQALVSTDRHEQKYSTDTRARARTVLLHACCWFVPRKIPAESRAKPTYSMTCPALSAVPCAADAAAASDDDTSVPPAAVAAAAAPVPSAWRRVRSPLAHSIAAV
jgi:hypothetical protein